MNDFTQVDEYLTRKLKENCDEFDKFLMIKISGVDGCIQLSNIYIRYIYDAAQEKVESGFYKDCLNFNEDWDNENISDIVASVYSRGMDKIRTLTDYKLSLVLNKYDQYEGRVTKYTLFEWLTGNEL